MQTRCVTIVSGPQPQLLICVGSPVAKASDCRSDTHAVNIGGSSPSRRTNRIHAITVSNRQNGNTPGQGRSRVNKESSFHGHISPASVGRVSGYVKTYPALDRDYVALSRPAFRKNILVDDMPVSPNWIKASVYETEDYAFKPHRGYLG